LETGAPAGHLTVEAAAKRLGLDDEGEYVVSEQEVAALAKPKKE
jgi:hypothetical protein